MKAAIKVRKAGEVDFEFIYTALCDLENEIIDSEICKRIFIENILNPNYLYLIAQEDGAKVGFITFHTQKLLHHSGLVGEIQEFYIAPNCRGKGVGRKLIDEIMRYAAQNELKSIEVTTNKRRVENIAIYERLGFVLTHNKFTISR